MSDGSASNNAPGPDRIASPEDVLGVVVRHRRTLWSYPAAATVLAIIIVFIVPRTYRSTVAILPPDQSFQTPAEAMGGAYGALGMAGGMSLPFMATPSDVLGEVLKSKRVRRRVVERLNLPERFDKSPVEAQGDLGEILSVKVAETGVIEASVDFGDRHYADTLINTIVEEADQINREIVNAKARETRLFVEERLSETRRDLSRAADALQAFQNQHRTIALDAEIAAMVGNAAQLRASVTADEIELSVLKSSLAPEHFRIRILENRIRETRRRIESVETTGSADSNTSFLGAEFSEWPAKIRELAQLTRDVKVAESLFELLTQQYETARIQELRDTRTLSVLDWASNGGGVVAPRMLMIPAATLVVSLGLVIIWIFLVEYFDRLARQDPTRFNRWRRLGRTMRQDALGLKGGARPDAPPGEE